MLNYKANLFVAKNFILISACYHLPACKKMDVTPRKRAQIAALKQHSNMTVRKIGVELNMSKSSVERIFKMMDTNRDITETQRQGCSGRKRRTIFRGDKIILQNTFKDARKTIKDFQKYLATSGVKVDLSIVRKRLLEAERNARSPRKEQLLTVAVQKKKKKTPKRG